MASGLFRQVPQAESAPGRQLRERAVFPSNFYLDDVRFNPGAAFNDRSPKGCTQFSNATPRESPSRQISRHLQILRKLSKDNSKCARRTVKTSERMPAPTLVISVTQHDRTPFCPPKNSKPPLSILVLAIDLRSFIAIMRALNDAQPLRQLCRLRRMRSSWMTVVKGIPLVPNPARLASPILRGETEL